MTKYGIGTTLVVVLMLSACSSADRYIAKREYLVTNQSQSAPPGGGRRDMWLTVEHPGIQGTPTKSPFSSNCDIFSISPDKCWYTYPSWSPDGSKFAVVAAALTAESVGPKRIHVSDWDGSRARNSFVLNVNNAANPTWDPEGRYILFDDGSDIWLSDTCNPNVAPSQVTTDSANDSDPTWSRDGKWVAFVSDRSGDREIWAISANLNLTIGGSPFGFGTPTNWTNTTGKDENLPYFSEIGPSPDTSEGINKIMFQKDNDLWWLPTPPGNAQPTQITSDGVKKRYAEFVLHNVAVAYVTDIVDQIMEVGVNTGNVQDATDAKSFGRFSSRQEWTGSINTCP